MNNEIRRYGESEIYEVQLAPLIKLVANFYPPVNFDIVSKSEDLTPELHAQTKKRFVKLWKRLNFNKEEFMKAISVFNIEEEIFDVYGFDSQEEFGDGDTNKEYLYTELRKKAKRDRQLKIYTYGKKHCNTQPRGSQVAFNACILNGRRKGLNLRKMNGTYPEVRKSVETSNAFDDFMTMMVEKIEREDLGCISVYCTAGRHRSVTCAIRLQEMLYPEATVIHLNLH